jgi:hypothetical protein
MSNDLQIPKPPTLQSMPELGYQAYVAETFGEIVQTVTFRLKDGNQFATPYHWLSELSYDPSTGIRLHFTDTTIQISGRNLETAFALLCEYKIRWLQEADRPTSLRLSDSAIVVDSIRKTMTTRVSQN